MGPPPLSHRKGRRALEAMRRARAGCRVLRVSNRCRVLVGLYHVFEAGLDASDHTPWATVCEAHASIITHEYRRQAEAALSYPDQWCQDCRAAFVRPSPFEAPSTKR